MLRLGGSESTSAREQATHAAACPEPLAARLHGDDMLAASENDTSEGDFLHLLYDNANDRCILSNSSIGRDVVGPDAV